MKGRTLGLGIAAGAVCFGLGVGVARLLAEPRPAAAPAYVVVSPGVGPRIVFDPESIQLLPDASLRLDLPPGFDAGGP